MASDDRKKILATISRRDHAIPEHAEKNKKENVLIFSS